jgi:pilus assembly protein Flp/PilA
MHIQQGKLAKLDLLGERVTTAREVLRAAKFNFKEKKMESFLTAAKRFASEDDGAQVIEYALIIAVVSIILVVALRGLTGASFSNFISRVSTCLTSGNSCA